MAIKVNTDLMESKASYASSLASQLKGTASEINYIYFGLDAKIKNRESIGSSLLSLQIRMDKLQRKMHNISDFLTNTASGYRSAEARVQSSLENVKFMNSASEKKSEPAKGKKKDKDEDKKWYQSNWFKLTVGAVVVGAAVAAAVLVGGPVLVGLAVGAVIGAGVGGVIGGISSKASGGEFIDGFSDGAMWGSISGAITGAAGAAGLGIKAMAAADGAVDSAVYVGQTMQNGGKVTATGVATSFVVGAGFSAAGAVVSNKISGFISNKVNAVTVKPEVKISEVAKVTSQFGREGISKLSAFSDGIGTILKKEGITPKQFNKMRMKVSSNLNIKQLPIMQRIRAAVPPPDGSTIFQKVIHESEISNYIKEVDPYITIGGFVTKAGDTKNLTTLRKIYDALRLDYKGTNFIPKSDESYGIIRFKTKDFAEALTPYGPAMGGNDLMKSPFTGHGFTKAKNGEIIPEFSFNKYAEPMKGATIFSVNSKTGVEQLVGIFKDGKFRKP